MTGSHDFDGDENFEDDTPLPGELIEGAPPQFQFAPPPKQPTEGAEFHDAGLYVIAMAMHRTMGGQLDWGLPLPFSFQDGATFMFHPARPDTDGL